MTPTYLYLDFEFNQTTNPLLNLVCVSFYNEKSNKKKTVWLHNQDTTRLKNLILKTQEVAEELILVAFAVTAEARSFLSLNLDPTKFKWIDLYLEYRQLLNHNTSLEYGRQLIKGRVVTTHKPPPKYARTEEDNFKNKSKPEYNLSAALFKLLNIKIDTAHKTKMRNLIISNPVEFETEDRKSILDYCESDVIYLPQLLKAIVKEYKKLLSQTEMKTLKSEMLLRGEFAARSAIIEATGYPINVQATRNFSNSVQSILNDCSKEINELFPGIQVFEYNKKTDRYVRKEKKLREWLTTQGHSSKDWTVTEKGALSLSLDAFTKHYNFAHTYPKNNFGAQMVRYLKLKQSLNGFMPRPLNSTRKTFWDFVGSDGRVRFFQGIYGSQAARSQPSATAFIPLKAAWTRALIQPPKGRALCSVDYGSQEFLISALMSNDVNMIKAYASGDPYLFLAKLAGDVPEDGLREKYSTERSIYKTVALGLSYGLTKFGLAKQLTQNLKREVDEDEAEELIEKFYNAFEDFGEFKTDTLDEYETESKLKLKCGWYLFGDNDNHRSVTNFPVQGNASAILRRAVKLVQEAGLNIVYTLHDAITIECDSYDFKSMKLLKELMIEAFHYYLPSKNTLIRCDVDAWSTDYKQSLPSYEDFTFKEKYIDNRSIDDYNRFNKYF